MRLFSISPSDVRILTAQNKNPELVNDYQLPFTSGVKMAASQLPRKTAHVGSNLPK
ncbi:MAG: hypothetical protein OEY56_13365 [Cyclobacteriaceae bacterium]|nr:hypothetical protein [Cyclobacteriaceae bacterium]